MTFELVAGFVVGYLTAVAMGAVTYVFDALACRGRHARARREFVCRGRS